MGGRVDVLRDADPRVTEIALDRIRIGVPIQPVGLSASLVLSAPAAVPLPIAVVAINALVLAVGVTAFLAIRRHRIARKHAHRIAALVWSLAPCTTLTSMLITREPNLVFPLLIE